MLCSHCSGTSQSKKVVLVEKGATQRSGSAGSGFDHWESACTNPCSGVTAKEIAEAYVNEQDGYSNGIGHYIECREGYDRLLDMESFGGKIRDTEDEFKGAAFRDDETKLMFAYDYKNKFTLRVWGSTFKPALYKELKRLGVKIYDRTEATALMVERRNGKTTRNRSYRYECTYRKIYDLSGKSRPYLPCQDRHVCGCLIRILWGFVSSAPCRASEADMPWATVQVWNLP